MKTEVTCIIKQHIINYLSSLYMPNHTYLEICLQNAIRYWMQSFCAVYIQYTLFQLSFRSQAFSSSLF